MVSRNTLIVGRFQWRHSIQLTLQIIVSKSASQSGKCDVVLCDLWLNELHWKQSCWRDWDTTFSYNYQRLLSKNCFTGLIKHPLILDNIHESNCIIIPLDCHYFGDDNASPPLWSSLIYLNSFWMDYNKNLYRHSWLPAEEPKSRQPGRF